MSESPAKASVSLFGSVSLEMSLVGQGYKCAHPEPCHIPAVCKAGMWVTKGRGEELWE